MWSLNSVMPSPMKKEWSCLPANDINSSTVFARVNLISFLLNTDYARISLFLLTVLKAIGSCQFNCSEGFLS